MKTLTLSFHYPTQRFEFFLIIFGYMQLLSTTREISNQVTGGDVQNEPAIAGAARVPIVSTMGSRNKLRLIIFCL
jgi:hypothetical protein